MENDAKHKHFHLIKQIFVWRNTFLFRVCRDSIEKILHPSSICNLYVCHACVAIKERSFPFHSLAMESAGDWLTQSNALGARVCAN